jgi:hypothetical protein
MVAYCDLRRMHGAAGNERNRFSRNRDAIMNTADLLKSLAELAAKLRETATELDNGTINKFHAANRLRKLARGIDGGK